MYIVRETFIAKPGHAGKFAKMMKEEMAKWPGFKGYVLLDCVTDYNKVVVEYELQSLADFEKQMQDHKKDMDDRKDKDSPPEYTQMYDHGKREIFKIVE